MIAPGFRPRVPSRAPYRGAMPGVLAQLACRLRDYARSLGLRVERIEASRISNSRSQYLRLRDHAGLCWIMRVSDHPRTASAAHRERPHFDLISPDGASGEHLARDWLDALTIGDIAWADPMDGVRRTRPQRRK